MGKKQKKQKNGGKESLESWVSSLAKECTNTEASTSAKSKKERIEIRAAKKRRREERRNARDDRTNEREVMRPKENEYREVKRTKLLSGLAEKMKESVTSYLKEYESRKGHAYNPDTYAKAKNKKKNWAQENIQPRNRDYGGIGLARPSMFLELADPAFFDKLESEFAEHIPGFFGKQRTKAMKKQQAGNMLWRKMADKKNANQRVNGRKLSDMSPDERVEAMIKAGMI